MSINLLPAELTSSGRQRAYRLSGLILLVIGYCCLTLLGYGFFSLRIAALEKQQETWHELLSEKEALQIQLETLAEQINIVEEEQTALETLLTREFSPAEVLAVLQQHLPYGLRVRQVTVSAEGWTIVHGEAGTMEAVSSFTASLGSDFYFSEVNLANLNLDQDQGIHRFTLQLMINRNRVEDNGV